MEERTGEGPGTGKILPAVQKVSQQPNHSSQRGAARNQGKTKRRREIER